MSRFTLRSSAAARRSSKSSCIWISSSTRVLVKVCERGKFRLTVSRMIPFAWRHFTSDVLVLDMCRGGFQELPWFSDSLTAWWRTVKIAEILVRRVGGTCLSFISSNVERHICFPLEIHFQYQFKKFKNSRWCSFVFQRHHRTAQNESHDENIHLKYVPFKHSL